MRLTHVEPERERQYADIRRLADALKIPIVETFLEIEVFDGKGRRIRRHAQRSHSYVRNAYNFIVSTLVWLQPNDDTWGDGKLNIKDSTGTLQYGIDPLYTYSSGYLVAAGQATRGILVGSGATAESFEDYWLDTQIPHGEGAGQLSHQAMMTYPVQSWESGTRVMSAAWERYFNNNSGGVITVREIAIVLYVKGAGMNWCNLLMSRDVLASAIDVPDAGQLKVTYTFEITYPS